MFMFKPYAFIYTYNQLGLIVLLSDYFFSKLKRKSKMLRNLLEWGIKLGITLFHYLVHLNYWTRQEKVRRRKVPFLLLGLTISLVASNMYVYNRYHSLYKSSLLISIRWKGENIYSMRHRTALPSHQTITSSRTKASLPSPVILLFWIAAPFLSQFSPRNNAITTNKHKTCFYFKKKTKEWQTRCKKSRSNTVRCGSDVCDGGRDGGNKSIAYACKLEKPGGKMKKIQ